MTSLRNELYEIKYLSFIDKPTRQDEEPFYIDNSKLDLGVISIFYHGATITKSVNPYLIYNRDKNNLSIIAITDYIRTCVMDDQIEINKIKKRKELENQIAQLQKQIDDI